MESRTLEEVLSAGLTGLGIPFSEETLSQFRRYYKLLEEKGFVNAQGGKITDTGSSKATMMISSSGFAINLSEHIRK